MYALAVSVTIEAGKQEEAQAALQSQVIPMIKQSPGLQGGYFMQPQEGVGYSLLVFDTEENASTGAEMAKNAPRPEFVEVGAVQVMEVVASI